MFGPARRTFPGQEIRVVAGVAKDDLAERHLERVLEDGSGVDKGVEFPILAAGIDVSREVPEERRVDGPTGEGRAELALDAAEVGSKSQGDEAVHEARRVALPERKEPPHPHLREVSLPVVSEVLEEDISVGHQEDAILRASRSLGERTFDAEKVRSLLEAKVVSALRSYAATQTLNDLHSNRDAFAREIKANVLESFAANGLNLE